MACEEAELYYRWQLLELIARGEMPAGMTEDDLRAMELPVPGEVELIEKPDGSLVIRKVEAKEAAPAPAGGSTGTKAKAAARAKAKKAAAAKGGKAKADAFVCDSPEDV